MSERIVFSNTALQGTTKSGTLKPDENGYYTVVLGALGIINSAGEEYVNTQAARDAFENNEVFQRRIRQGLLRAEWGHPKPEECANMLAFERRVRRIDEDRICAHISDVSLQEITHKGERILGIIGKIRPSGPYGEALQKMLDNPKENVTFSGRYYSNVKRSPSGRISREIHTCGTWDFVSEPGVESANKFNSPTLESFSETEFLPEWITKAAQEENVQLESGLTMEAGGHSANDLMKELGLGTPIKTHKRMDW